jgi:hypothetical protein
VHGTQRATLTALVPPLGRTGGPSQRAEPAAYARASHSSGDKTWGAVRFGERCLGRPPHGLRREHRAASAVAVEDGAALTVRTRARRSGGPTRNADATKL